MPLNIDVLQILLHMLNFVILAGGLIFLLYNPVIKFLDERKKHFEDLENENKRIAEENEKLKSEYEARAAQIKKEIEEMRSSAEKELADISKSYLNEAKEKASAIISAAEREAEDRKEHILDSAQTEIGELVITAAQKLLSDTVTPERDSAMYDKFIELAQKTVTDKRSSK